MKVLDKLIESALEDFVVTDEERTVLLNKANEIGLGKDEFKLYLNGKIQERMKDKPEEKVEEKKKGFTDALTEQKIAVDETYNGLVEKAKEAMEGLDLGEEAANAMGSTVLGIAQGISQNVDSVSAAVTELMNALNPLTDLGFKWGFSDGSFLLELDGSNEKGLDYVPFDGYLSELHEGEGILTAEENRIWQRFKNGQQGHANVDYEALGGVMRDNVKTGGDVYLDGRTVGQVVSGIQGRSYRNLQRSGWQG